MADVAAHVNLSPQTVSRVLNDHPNVSASARSRVLAAIEELGYRRNLIARGLATGRSQVVGVLAQNSTLFGPSSMLDALTVAAEESDMSITVGNLHGFDLPSIRQAVNRLLEQGVAGVVLILPVASAASVYELAPPDVPIVTVDGRLGEPGVLVSVDQHLGGYRATQHLLEHGHEAVWHVGGPEQWNDSRAREDGWRRALTEAGIEAPPILRSDWSARGGYAAGQLLARIPECSAVFAANDHIALGILRALRERGRSVPGDVSVVGFDDVPESEYFWPPLTTVHQEFREVGRVSLELLLQQLRAGERSDACVLIPPELVVRQSVRPPARSS